MHLNWNHRGQLYTGGKKQAASIKWFISLQGAYLGPESIVLAVPLSVIAQRVQLVLGRLPADLSFCSTLGFPFWLMKPHVTMISLASVKECLLQLPLYISLLCFSFDLVLKHATPSRQKKKKNLHVLLWSALSCPDEKSKSAFYNVMAKSLVHVSHSRGALIQ